MIILDWDGTAITAYHDDAILLVQVVERFLALRNWLIIVADTNFSAINRQFCQLIHDEKRGHLLVCANRGI
ncbi:MAG: hypothetical protein ACXWQ5_18620 [Ktedonobacterales bacterium]